MEVEVKLRLADSHSHQKLTALLSPYRFQTLLQENLFLDTPSADLAANLAALRLRFYNHDSRCVLSFKSKPTITNGVSTAEELEHELEPSLGRACAAQPWRLGLVPSNPVSDRVSHLLGSSSADVGVFGKLVCLGGFRNVRNVYEWKGLRLEVDETLFDFGVNYEIECECDEPVVAMRLIEELLVNNEISDIYKLFTGPIGLCLEVRYAEAFNLASQSLPFPKKHGHNEIPMSSKPDDEQRNSLPLFSLICKIGSSLFYLSYNAFTEIAFKRLAKKEE
ncbi:hypothetical protein Dimus_027855 [Dionaea muscipula]